MKMKTHENEIELSRRGGFGASDAKMFYKIGTKGLSELSDSDKKRIRVAKGVEPYQPAKKTGAMQKGHDFETWYEETVICNHQENYEREPKISKTMAANFDTFFHADFYCEETATVLELKCLSNPKTVGSIYSAQVQWQYMISDATDIFFIVADSRDDDFIKNLTTARVNRNETVISVLKKGIEILDKAWNSLELGVGDELNVTDLLPFQQKEIQLMYHYLNEVKVMQRRADLVKGQLKTLMENGNIKSLKSAYYTITLTPASLTHSLDKEKLFSEHPEISEEDYIKKSIKKSYLTVKLL